MAHEIFGARFLSRGVSAWHNLGRVFDADTRTSLADAVSEVSTGIEHGTTPLFYEVDGARHDAGLRAVVRRPTAEDAETRVLGTVGRDYELRQFGDYAQALNPLSDEYPVETAGILRKGDQLFFALRAETTGVKGRRGPADEVSNYFVGLVNQRPGNAHSILHTPVRVVCANTLSMALGNNSVRVKIDHRAGAVDEMAAAASVVAAMKAGAEAGQAALTALARTAATPEQMDRVIRAAFPTPQRPRLLRLLGALTPEQVETMKGGTVAADKIDAARAAYEKTEAEAVAVRAAARERLDVFQQEFPHFAGTAWAVYNACTETADWRKGASAAGSLFGDGAREKRRAFAACLDLAGMNTN